MDVTTAATDFPQAPPIVPNPTGGFVAKFTPQMSALDYVTFLGAQINGLAIYQAYSRLPYRRPARKAGLQPCGWAPRKLHLRRGLQSPQDSCPRLAVALAIGRQSLDRRVEPEPFNFLVAFRLPGL